MTCRLSLSLAAALLALGFSQGLAAETPPTRPLSRSRPRRRGGWNDPEHGRPPTRHRRLQRRRRRRRLLPARHLSLRNPVPQGQRPAHARIERHSAWQPASRGLSAAAPQERPWKTGIQQSALQRRRVPHLRRRRPQRLDRRPRRHRRPRPRLLVQRNALARRPKTDAPSTPGHDRHRQGRTPPLSRRDAAQLALLHALADRLQRREYRRPYDPQPAQRPEYRRHRRRLLPRRPYCQLRDRRRR